MPQSGTIKLFSVPIHAPIGCKGSINLQDLVHAVSRLEDYGLATAIISNNESLPSGELFINIKVELIDNSVLFIREYISAKQEQVEHFSYAYQYQSADKSLIFGYFVLDDFGG